MSVSFDQQTDENNLCWRLIDVSAKMSTNKTITTSDKNNCYAPCWLVLQADHFGCGTHGPKKPWPAAPDFKILLIRITDITVAVVVENFEFFLICVHRDLDFFYKSVRTCQHMNCSLRVVISSRNCTIKTAIATTLTWYHRKWIAMNLEGKNFRKWNKAVTPVSLACEQSVIFNVSLITC